MLLNNFLENSAENFSEKIALVCQGQRLTYQQINSSANKLASGLKDSGVERGDRVAIFLENSAESVLSIFGILKADAVFVVINPTTKKDKLAYILNNCRVKALITSFDKLDPIQEVLQKSTSVNSIILAGKQESEVKTSLPDKRVLYFDEVLSSYPDDPLVNKNIDLDLASIIYTSGTTGNPKGVMLSHLNMVSAANSITKYLENTSEDVILNVLPLSFDYGLYQVLMGFKIGGRVVLEKSFLYPYVIIDLMLKEKVTGFPGVPTIFAILLQLADLKKQNFDSLRYITNTAAALPVAFIKKIRGTFPKAKLYSMYGLTECKRVSYLPPEELDTRPNSIGKGMPNEEVYIVNENGQRVEPGETGELVVRGSNVMLGYWELPEETARVLKPGPLPWERVLYTGDLFQMDQEGFLYFVGRKDDIIKCRGEKVSPKEIENILYNLEGIVEAAVVGVPDEILGQAIKAFAVLKEGIVLSENDILRYCQKNLEDFMVPKYVEIVETLPKTESGKIRKVGLK
ncbi:MAG TPA: AMP-binding protein [Terriglobales bacterium]|nr:AMP-binding protein [Terriglobales bacterium]